MNKTGIEWTDYTWNPLTGCTMAGACAVNTHCYAQRTALRLAGRFGYPESDPFAPTFHPDRMQEPYHVRKPSKIFVCSMGDLFCSGVGDSRIKEVLKAANDLRHHTFIFLTKNPYRYKYFKEDFSKNCWIGTTINTVKDLERLDVLTDITKPDIRFISFEPLYESMHALIEHEYTKKLLKLDWFIIGGQTKPKKQPEVDWIRELVSIGKTHGIKIFLKNNLCCHPKLQEFLGKVCDRCGAESDRLYPVYHVKRHDDKPHEWNEEYCGTPIKVCWDCDFEITNGRGEPNDEIYDVLEARREQEYLDDPINNPPPRGYL